MSTKLTTQTIQQADGTTLSIETGLLARQANGAVVLRQGNMMLMATAVMKKNEEPVGFLPLSVDYREKHYAGGKIPGGFLKRETRPSDHEVLTSRLVDRALRPCFPKDFSHSIQITIWLLSTDKNVEPEPLAALAASAALSISDIPFQGPISEVRVARIDGKLCVNPTPSALEQADMNLIIAASSDRILMIEGEMKEVSEEELLTAIQFGHEAIKPHCKAQQQLAATLGIEQKEIPTTEEDTALIQQLNKAFYKPCYEVARQALPTKPARSKAFKALKENYLATLSEEEATNTTLIDEHFTAIKNQAIKDLILQENIRLDGRVSDKVRNIDIAVDYLPSAHGSALFTRGETQALNVVTLGGERDRQLVDGATKSEAKKEMLQYHFPDFCTGEIKFARGVSRREIGHGNLALRALKNVLPTEENNPYTIRIVSEILESNGSSSMATVCAASLALMDAGIAIKKPVSGIAMGLISGPSEDKHVILSDISGEEDALGDMDFKVAGTQDGITACQMDIKIAGLSYHTLRRALEQARKGRLHILDIMNKALPASRTSYKSHAPSMHTMRVDGTMIGAIIGPGGKVIKDIQTTTGATINITEEGDYGLVSILASDQDAMQQALKRIQSITAVPTVGDTYVGKVKSIKDFGAFVEFMPGKDGLLHISEISHDRINDISQVLKVGQEFTVQLINIHPKTGKFALSKKALEKGTTTKEK